MEPQTHFRKVTVATTMYSNAYGIKVKFENSFLKNSYYSKNFMSIKLSSQHCFPPDVDCRGATHQEMTGEGARDVEQTTYSLLNDQSGLATTLEKDNDCCQKCGLNPDCEYWVRATDSNKCWLKSNGGRKIEKIPSRIRRGGLRPSKYLQFYLRLNFR